jgi:hypothetical protein
LTAVNFRDLIQGIAKPAIAQTTPDDFDFD